VTLLHRVCRRGGVLVAQWQQALAAGLWARPVALTHASGTGTDLVRSRAQLLAEHALLGQQLLMLRRSVTRPAVTSADRALLVLLAGRVDVWRQALLLVRPETLLRWHRAGFRARWRRQSRPEPGRPPLPAETVALIRRMAADNPLWGAERLRGALGTLGIAVAKRIVQTYLRGPRGPRPRGQTWATFLRHHAHETWACDFLPVTALLFRPLFAFFVVEPGTRRVVHVGATRHPTGAWVAQQRREATPFGRRPRYLIRDNDGTFGPDFARVAEASGITILRTPYRAPRATAVCERFLGVCAAHAWITCSFSARATSPACSASTSRTSSGRACTRASARRSPSRPPKRPGIARGRYARCRSWAGGTSPISAPPPPAAPPAPPPGAMLRDRTGPAGRSCRPRPAQEGRRMNAPASISSAGAQTSIR